MRCFKSFSSFRKSGPERKGFLKSFSRDRPSHLTSLSPFSDFSIEKITRRFVGVLIETFRDIDSALIQLEMMLPCKIFLKNLISFCSGLKIPFIIDELKFFLSSLAEGRNYLKFEDFVKVLKEYKETEKEKKMINVDEGTDTNDLPVALSPVYRLNKKKLKTILSFTLSEKFENFLQAFSFVASGKSVTFFGFLKLVRFLGVFIDEKLASELFYEISYQGHLSLNRFKALWFNKDDLCAVAVCSQVKETLSEFCEFHLKQTVLKGKKAFKRLFEDLDLKSQVFVKGMLKKSPFPEPKFLKSIFDRFACQRLKRDDWKSMAQYFAAKGEKVSNASPIMKVKRNSLSLQSLPRTSHSATRPKRQELKKMKVISFTNDTVVLTTA
jgi:hypothetical protein